MAINRGGPRTGYRLDDQILEGEGDGADRTLIGRVVEDIPGPSAPSAIPAVPAMGDHSKYLKPAAVRVPQLGHIAPEPQFDPFQRLLRHPVIPIRRHQQPAQSVVRAPVVVMIDPAPDAAGRICQVHEFAAPRIPFGSWR
jgi:hypothetical protein